MKIKMGVICPSEIAFRRFMPALQKCEQYEYIGIAIANEQEWFGDTELKKDIQVLKNEEKKAECFQQTYGGKIFKSYKEILNSKEIDALYIPLPPSLHYRWAKAALEAGKHVLVEKPSTGCAQDTQKLIELAGHKGLAFHENYMFVYHRQIKYIQDVIASGKLGDIRLYRIAFGFPFRGKQDFRYNKALGGGALLDCGGYTLKLATLLLGETAYITDSYLGTHSDFNVDLYGSATLRNSQGITAQVSFGMDNSYKCELEVWGSEGCLVAGRIFTAPVDFSPSIMMQVGHEKTVVSIEPDDQFYHSLQHFYACIIDAAKRGVNVQSILKQIILLEHIKKVAREEEY